MEGCWVPLFAPDNSPVTEAGSAPNMAASWEQHSKPPWVRGSTNLRGPLTLILGGPLLLRNPRCLFLGAAACIVSPHDA